jgi:hypothetical protein
MFSLKLDIAVLCTRGKEETLQIIGDGSGQWLMTTAGVDDVILNPKRRSRYQAECGEDF